MNIEEAINKVDSFVNTITVILPKYSTAIPEYCIDEESWIAIKKVLTAYEKEKEKNKELQSDIQQKNFEIKCLSSDIKNMYCEEGVIAILEDNFDLSRDEAIQILEEE